MPAFHTFFVPQEFRRRLEMGQRHLESYYEQYKDNWTYQVQVELSIRNVEMKGVPLVGTIDKLEIERENIAYIEFTPDGTVLEANDLGVPIEICLLGERPENLGDQPPHSQDCVSARPTHLNGPIGIEVSKPGSQDSKEEAYLLES